jgi:hypothetical protein
MNSKKGKVGKVGKVQLHAKSSIHQVIMGVKLIALHSIFISSPDIFPILHSIAPKKY